MDKNNTAGVCNAIVMRLSAMGDVAISVPVLNTLLQQNPGLEITLLSNPRYAFMFQPLPRTTFVGVDTKQRHKGLWGMFKLWRELKEDYHFGSDACDCLFIDIHDVIRSKFLRKLLLLSGVGNVVIDKGREQKSALVKNGAVASEQLKASYERYADTFRAAGFKLGPTYCLPQYDLPKLDFIDNSKKYVSVAPFAQHQGKIYPLEKMKEAVGLLAGTYGLNVLLFGAGPEERQVLEGWAAEIDGVTSLAGRLTSLQELSAMKHSRVMLSMDSANMHLASLVGVRTISIWGATHPKAGFNGFGQSLGDCIQTEMDCRPCSVYGNKPCSKGGYPCMNQILPESVAKAVAAAAGVV